MIIKNRSVTYFVTLSFLFLLSIPNTAGGAPALDEPRRFRQPDGSEFTAFRRGDERYNWVETARGYGILKNRFSGYWEYLLPSPAPQAAPQGSGKQARYGALSSKLSLPVGSIDPEREGIPRGLRPVPDAPGAGAGDTGSSPQSLFGTKSFLQVRGTVPVLVILAEFSDRGGTYPAAGFQARFFQTAGSVKDYFAEVSYGNMTIGPVGESHGTVDDGIVGWLDLGTDHPDPGSVRDARNQTISKMAIEAADPYVNYAAYDTDGDGLLTPQELSVVVVVAGFEGSYDDGSPGVWGHAWSMFRVGYPVVDGVTIRLYSQIGEIHRDHVSTIGIMVHELGHQILDWPDLYDTDDTSSGIGCFGLMGYGGWGRSLADPYSGTTPVHPLGFLKYRAGWISANPVSSNGTYEFRAAFDSSEGVRRILTKDPNQYFMVENREPLGYDRGLFRWLGAGGGMLITHIDESVSDNSDENHKMVDVEEASEEDLGYSQLDTKENNGDPHHLFWSGNRDVFADFTRPDSKLYDGTSSDIALTAISPAGSVMTARVSLSAQTSRWYVDVNAAGTGDGMTWANAFPHPQDALDLALPGNQVWVARGIYTRREPEDTFVVEMKEGVELYGGFSAIETDISQRDVTANATILDGENTAEHVVLSRGVSGRLDGFTLRGGNAANMGGGILIDRSSSVIANCRVTGNYARNNGGGIANYDHSFPKILNTYVSGNTAENSGGGIYNYYYSSPVITNTVLSGNRALYGGGGVDSTHNCFPVFTNCTVTGNAAVTGGAFYNPNTSSLNTLKNCILWGNFATVDQEIYGPASAVYSNIAGGYPGTGNMDSDPLFAASGSYDDNGSPATISDDTFVEGDYHLQAGSPCINSAGSSGAPGEDIEGRSRPQGPGFDMGAYEFPESGSTGGGSSGGSGGCRIADLGEEEGGQPKTFWLLIFAAGWFLSRRMARRSRADTSPSPPGR